MSPRSRRPAWRRSTRRRTSTSRRSCATSSRSSPSATASRRAPEASSTGATSANDGRPAVPSRVPGTRRRHVDVRRAADRVLASATMPATGDELGRRLRDRDLAAAPAVLNLVESRAPGHKAEIDALLHAVSPAALGREAPAHVVGVTGPPGVGKSSLLSELVRAWRAQDRSVAVLAVDPTSKRSGGALLGDRARIAVDPTDRGLFIRSTAAGDQLGGLAPSTRAAAHALATAFDVVVIETVGVGQSETDVADVADTVAVVVQPGSGDVLQFLKAGIMEVPDVLVVNKADLGQVAVSAERDLRSALRALDAPDTEVISVSCLPPPRGIEELIAALDAHRERTDLSERRLQARRAHALADFAAEHGERGLRSLGGRREAERWLGAADPGLDVPTLTRALEERAMEDA